MKTWKPVLFSSDAAYDLECGRFVVSLRPCELEARFAYWRRYARFKVRTLWRKLPAKRASSPLCVLARLRAIEGLGTLAQASCLVSLKPALLS